MLQKVANILWRNSQTSNEVIVCKNQEIALEQEFPSLENLVFSWATELTCHTNPLERLIFEKTHQID